VVWLCKEDSFLNMVAILQKSNNHREFIIIFFHGILIIVNVVWTFLCMILRIVIWRWKAWHHISEITKCKSWAPKKSNLTVRIFKIYIHVCLLTFRWRVAREVIIRYIPAQHWSLSWNKQSTWQKKILSAYHALSYKVT
jgi:hypothetical protein